MFIQILGPGCKNCALLESRAKEAISVLGIQAEFSKVTDYDEILAFGVMATPGLVVNGKVLLSGKVPTANSIRELIEAEV